ncbi:hypothetical protein [uncultured Maricaulis sp.]|uniref:hypothetical protein n=1 Tax=uncultured Maricaulis sp. TaxID=174710 RepID=UPI0025F34C28|nr:hypothetical protein [uncultured Maricaulis sp.]
MFVGHYGPALAGKTIAKSVPLWAFFLAVQFVDVLWGIFIANGIEHVRIVPGFTEANPLDLYDMPITHSLPGALGWSVLAGLAWMVLAPRQKRAGALAIGLAVFSHWLLDLVVHVPDLELWPGGMRVGFGLWNNYPVALAVEFGVLLGGFVLYLRMTAAKGLIGRIWPWVFMALLALAEFANHAAPIPEDMEMAGYMGTATFLVLTALAGICDLTRKTR